MTNAEALALAARHYQAGQLAPAEQLCSQIVQGDPGDAYAWHLLGLLAYRARGWDEALACFGRALHLRPELAEVHNSRGAALIACGRLEEALASIREALRLQPDNFWSHALAAICSLQLKRPAEAKAELNACLQRER